MTLDLPAMQALWALAESDATAAVRELDETGVGADDVEDATLRPLWAALEERIRGRRSVDVVTLAECLRAAGVLGEVRLERVSALGEYVPRGVEVERLRMLREAGARRQCLEAMRAAAVKLKAGAPLVEVEAELRLLPSLVAGVRPRVRSAKGDTLRIVDEAEAAWREGRSPTLRTGWEQLDACWRLIPNLHAVGAQGGVGKTALVAGLVRGWTDGAWEGYLCDLAVHPDVAREGVAEELLRAATDGRPGIRWTIPAEFVPRARLEAFGWIRNPNGWLLPREG